MTDNIIVTTHEALDNDTAPTLNKAPKTGSHVPFGLAGVVAGECTVLCTDCASDDQLRDDEGNESAIFGNDEWDYPGAICDDCGTYLDTYLLVYLDHDPELWWRLNATEQVGGYPDTDCYDAETIADKVESEAYEMGWEFGEPMEGEFGPDGEHADAYPELPTDSARWANHIRPKLRALCGFNDPTGKGTYTEAPTDAAQRIYNEGAFPAFRRGYVDRLEGKDFGASKE